MRNERVMGAEVPALQTGVEGAGALARHVVDSGLLRVVDAKAEVEVVLLSVMERRLRVGPPARRWLEICC
jgi:hypothetical protein